MFKSSAVLILAFLMTTTRMLAQDVPDTVVIRNDQPADTSTIVEAPVMEDYESTESADEDSVHYLAGIAASDSLLVPVRSIPGAKLKRMREDDAFWYLKERKEKKASRRSTGSASAPNPFKWAGTFRILFWVLITIGILALLYFFLESMGIRIFSKRPLALSEEEAGETAEDIFNRNYENEVENALASGDYRMAIRLRYLQLLRELAERNIIQYRQGSSNGSYVGQLWGSPFYDDFFSITRTFDYAWYGMLPMSARVYEAMLADITHLKSRFA
jgi:hypothetical protein